jgi:hypothetical protein
MRRPSRRRPRTPARAESNRPLAGCVRAGATLSPPIPPIFPSIADVFPAIAAVFGTVAHVFEPVAKSASVPAVDPILPPIPDVFATVANVFTPIAKILDPVANLARWSGGYRRNRAQHQPGNTTRHAQP